MGETDILKSIHVVTLLRDKSPGTQRGQAHLAIHWFGRSTAHYTIFPSCSANPAHPGNVAALAFHLHLHLPLTSSLFPLYSGYASSPAKL